MIHEVKRIKLPLATDQKRVVIIGGGFAGINIAKSLIKNPSLQIVMLDRHNYHLFQPLLYQVATSGLDPDSIAEPLRNLFSNQKNFFFRLAKAEQIDDKNQIIHTHIGSLNYDYLIIANGAKTNYFGNEDNFKGAFPLKQLHQALALRNHILQCVEEAVLTTNLAKQKACLTFVIVGGGPTGVEVAGAIAELKSNIIPKDYPDLDASLMEIVLVEAGSKVLPALNQKSSERALKYLNKITVNTLLNTPLKSYINDVVTFNNGNTITAKTLIWGAGVTGNIIDGLPQTSIERSRILVDEYSKVIDTENIFAIGDIACMKTEKFPNGHPMVAPVAIQCGRLLGKNIINLLQNKPLKPFYYKNKGAMATIGRNLAVVDLPFKLKIGGSIAWLTWMFIHLISITGFRNKLMVFIHWFWRYLTYDRGNRIIIRNFERKQQAKNLEEAAYDLKEEKEMSIY